MKPSDEQIAKYGDDGHLALPGLFSEAQMDAATQDAMDWADETLANISAKDAQWYLDAGATGRHLRKLDNPVHERRVYRELAAFEPLVEMVEGLLGRPGVSVYFSQIFFKAPDGGGPKPSHQDNFYFGPSDPEALITAWIALDDATLENGCLYYGTGSHLLGLAEHNAPPDEPFNLQLTADAAARYQMSPAPMTRGGVLFHHGATVHQSGDNLSARWRRAVAFHYVGNGVRFVDPAWEFDASLVERIS